MSENEFQANMLDITGACDGKTLELDASKALAAKMEQQFPSPYGG